MSALPAGSIPKKKYNEIHILGFYQTSSGNSNKQEDIVYALHLVISVNGTTELKEHLS